MTKAELDYLTGVIERTIESQFRRMTLETLTSAEVSKAEAARVLNVTVGTIRNWVKSGRLKETKSGKISRESLAQKLQISG